MKQKKVLFVATVVRMHINLFHIPYIKWFHDQGWQVDVAANNDYDVPEDCVIPFCNHFYCLPFERKPIKKANLDTYFQLKKIINENNYDIIHCHTPMGSVITRLAALHIRKNGAKVIYTAHGFHFYKGAPLINWLIYYPIEKILSSKTDVLITMNKEDYVRAKKFHMKQLEYIHGIGLNRDKFKINVDKERVRFELGIKQNDIFAISVAQLIKRKNHMVLIEAIHRLNNPHFKLFICGDGIQYDELKNKIKEYQLENQVYLLGFRKDIYKLLNSADLFLFASLQEGLPVAIMEAMACGLPIICSNIRGNADLIDIGKGGYLVECNDINGYIHYINKFIYQPNELEKMKKYNLEKIHEFDLQKVLHEMSDIYKSVMSEGNV